LDIVLIVSYKVSLSGSSKKRRNMANVRVKQIAKSEDWHIPKEWDWPLQHHDGFAPVHNTEDKFEVELDAPMFTPKEVEVKVYGNDLLVSCIHEDKRDLKANRQVYRAYHLPPDVDKTSITSNLDPNGTLRIQAAKKK